MKKGLRRLSEGTMVGALALALAACGGTQTAREPNSLPTDTLATVVADTPDLSDFAALVSEAELGSVFDGRGVYTVLAPTNDAFEKNGQSALSGENGGRALLVAAIRKQILPGYLTTDAIAQGIDSHDGSVEMRTLGESTVTFTRDGDAIRVTGEDGETALVADDATPATNGALLPIDGLLTIDDR